VGISMATCPNCGCPYSGEFDHVTTTSASTSSYKARFIPSPKAPTSRSSSLAVTYSDDDLDRFMVGKRAHKHMYRFIESGATDLYRCMGCNFERRI